MTEKFEFTDKLKKALYIAMGAGILGLVIAFFLYPQNNHSRFWSNLLLNIYYFTGIGLFGLFFVAANQLGYSGWIIVVRRVILSLSSFVLVGAPLLLLIALLTWVGAHNIYDHWLHVIKHPESIPEKMTTKAIYLNLPFWTSRILIYAALWVFFTRLFSRFFEKDLTDKKNYKISKLISAAWIVVFAVTESAVSWDMVMSIDPHWYSTLFGWYNFASYSCAGFAFAILLTIFLKSQGYLPQVNENHIHDLGKFLFGFSVFWTYLWFSQFMLQWYANIPEDTAYWVKRFSSGFFAVIILTLLINFLLPLLVLMKRGSKRNFKTVSFVSVMVIIGHYLDFYNMIMYEPNVPAASHAEHHAQAVSKNYHLYAANEPAKDVDHATSNTSSEKAGAAIAPHGKSDAAGATDHQAKPGSHHAEAAHGSHDSHDAHGTPSHLAGFGLPEILIFIGFAGLFLFMFFSELSKYALINEK
ncbi:MAG: hypothetical protein RMJ53_00160, partial [Chitinophagales bacterium]|nr:hypothetical protein [Chitinophagales bacterium]MDW8272626.1 hypothetical protein [Chitinophagales bacterium]